MESDMGIFEARGLKFPSYGDNAATDVMREVVKSLAPVGTDSLVSGGGGEDITGFESQGVPGKCIKRCFHVNQLRNFATKHSLFIPSFLASPGASIDNANERYFWFHHSDGDTMSVLSNADVDCCAVTWAVAAFAVANLDDKLPRVKAPAQQ
jgi:carboxypeptidase Q